MKVAPLAPEEVARRRPVWSALSELFLDTTLDARDHVFIARRLRESGYDDATLRRILAEEVAAVCAWNLMCVAGEWAGFDPEWLEVSILRLLAAGAVARWLERRGACIARRMTEGDLRAVMSALSRLRQDPVALARTLGTGPPEARAAAARELAFLGRDAGSAASALRGAASGDPDAQVRAAAVEAAWRVERFGALEVALRAAADPDGRTQRAGLEVVAEATVDPEALQRASPPAIPPQAVEAAATLLRDPDPRARKVAAAALGALAALGAERALDAALAGLDEEDGEVRIAIANAAVLAGASEARLAPVVAALGGAPAARRRTAAQVLVLVARKEGPEARWALAPLLAAASQGDPVVRTRAATALGWMRGAAAEARPLLAKGTTESDPEVRAACLGALARVDAALGAPPLDLLLAAMEAPDSHARNAGYFALYELGAAAAPALPRLEVMAKGRGLGKDLDRRVKAKVVIDRIRAASENGGTRD